MGSAATTVRSPAAKASPHIVRRHTAKREPSAVRKVASASHSRTRAVAAIDRMVASPIASFTGVRVVPAAPAAHRAKRPVSQRRLLRYLPMSAPDPLRTLHTQVRSGEIHGDYTQSFTLRVDCQSSSGRSRERSTTTAAASSFGASNSPIRLKLPSPSWEKRRYENIGAPVGASAPSGARELATANGVVTVLSGQGVKECAEATVFSTLRSEHPLSNQNGP